MKKAFLSLALLAFGLVAVSQPVYHEEVYHMVGTLYYHITSDSTVELSPMQDCEVFPRNITIPASVSINGHNYIVNRIGDQAFSGSCASVESLTLPPTIEEIGKESFNSFSAQITLPESVRRIETGAFAYIDVVEFHIPCNVEQIAEQAFMGAAIERFTVDSANNHYVAVDSVALCSSDTTLLLAYTVKERSFLYTVPAPVRRIASGAFAQNNYLATLILPEGLREIGSWMANSTRLKNLHIPASVCRIEGSLRDTASTWFNLTVDPASRHYKMVDNQLMSYDGDTLIQVLGTEGEYTVPTGVRVLSDGLFYNNQRLTKIILPDGITTISDAVFALSSPQVTIPSSVLSIGTHAFFHNSGTKRVSLPNLTYMGDGAFESSAIETVDSLLSLRTIPQGAFKESSLRTINYGDQVETLGDHAFYGAPFSPSAKVMPASLKRLGMKAYYPRNKVKSITFTGRVDTIGERALRCHILHLRDTHMPYIYPSALNETDTVYTPCGYAEAFERGIPHPDHVVFADWCHPEGIAGSEAQPAAVLYPNPARGSFTVSGLPEGETLLTVTDLAGRTLLRQTISGPSATIDAATLPAGSYLVTLAYPQGSSSQKLVLQ